MVMLNPECRLRQVILSANHHTAEQLILANVQLETLGPHQRNWLMSSMRKSACHRHVMLNCILLAVFAYKYSMPVKDFSKEV
jgi:hypothetical protein